MWKIDPDLDGGGVPLPETVVDYLIWYHLGRPDAEGRGLDAVSVASIYRWLMNQWLIN